MFRVICVSFFLLVSLGHTQMAVGKQTEVAASTYKLLQNVDKLIAASSYGSAIGKLNAALPDLAAGSADRAVVLRSLASAYAMKKDYANAARSLQAALDTGALPVDQKADARRTLGELYIASGQYQKGVKYLESSIGRGKAPTSDQYFMLANAYAQAKNYKKAAPYMRKAVDKASNPSVEWYRMLLALDYESGNYRDGVKTLRELIRRFPNEDENWVHLIAMYSKMNDRDSALAVSELAYKKGILTSPDEILNLAGMMSERNLPYRSARLLEKEIAAGRVKAGYRTWIRVADEWSRAREYDKAVAALKKAAALNSSGDPYYRIGQIYVEQAKWKQAHAVLLKAINSGSLSDPGNAQILFGLSCYELHFKDQARQAFAAAKKYSNSRSAARQWTNYLDADG